MESVDVRTPLIAAERKHLGVVSAMFLMVNYIIGTGIFSIPSAIYLAVGSVGWSLILWIVGGFIAFCGFNVYFEWGLEMPRSGGEKNYLARLFPWPKHLSLSVFAMTSVLLGVSTSNSFSFGSYIQMSFGVENPDADLAKRIGCVLVTAIGTLHAVAPEAGKAAFNVLGMVKLFMLVCIAGLGILVLFDVLDVAGGKPNNFKNVFQHDGFGGGAYNLAIAFLRVSYSYRGWESPNQVMGEVHEPKRTLAIAGPLALACTTTLYFLCNVAYFLVIPKHEIADSGATVAGLFFQRLFGASASSRILPFCICLSNIGNVLAVCFASSRITMELGKLHVLPLSNFFASTKPFGTPLGALGLHVVTTVLALLLPPSDEVYNLIIDMTSYPASVFALIVTAGLLYLQANHKKLGWRQREVRHESPKVFTVIFLLVNLMMVIFAWVPPRDKINTQLPYYTSPLCGLLVLVSGYGYWLWWRNTPGARKLDAVLDEYGHVREDVILPDP